ncbi:hypothetical protein VKT23_020028 [Stygiomarasmius scandens]|uniref:Uncharacterized protein n=1 Tax=Marasmiellus scandens TaxID=2682957 RepID=A0ABR1IJX3_9AGAR
MPSPPETHQTLEAPQGFSFQQTIRVRCDTRDEYAPLPGFYVPRPPFRSFPVVQPQPPLPDTMRFRQDTLPSRLKSIKRLIPHPLTLLQSSIFITLPG